MKVKIIETDHMGQGIAKDDNKIIFIPKAICGDVCDINIVYDSKKYSKGRINNIIIPSEDRIEAKCPYYNMCGGCNISNLPYEKQLLFKKNKVINIFKKYLNLNIDPEIIASDMEYGYRNKVTFHNDKVLGLVSIDNSVLNIDYCLLATSRINKLYTLIKKENLSKVKKITIKEVDNGLQLNIDGHMNIDNLKDYCLSITINNKIIYKKECGFITVNNVKYMVSNNSFFQVNTGNIYKLYDLIIKMANFNENDKVIDLYCGVGSISLYIANYVKEVLGIEIIDSAIEDAKENAKMNNITNVSFISGDVVDYLNKIDGNTVIVDPPRIGIDDKTIKFLNNMKLDKIIYVSCDPMTLTRDIKKLDKYEIHDIAIVDMFPQTHHVECVSVLHRKSAEK